MTHFNFIKILFFAYVEAMHLLASLLNAEVKWLLYHLLNKVSLILGCSAV